MTKIAFHLNCLVHGGAERVVANLANRFAREGDEIIVATEWTDENEYELDPAVRRVHVGLRPEDEKKSRLSKIVLRRRYLREFLLKEKPDVLVAFAIKANYRALSACPGTGVPVVISVRIDPQAFYTGPVNRIATACLFGRAAGCVFQTEDARKFFAPLLQDNSVIIYNPITPKYIEAPSVKQEEREKFIVNVGRLVDFKNQAMLVRAFAGVLEKYPDYTLRIYGPDSGDGTKQILEKEIRDHHLEEKVFLMGDCNTLEKEIAKAAVFAFSSDYEGMPNALLEAMALGLPVISTDCRPGAPRMMIRDGENGLLIPVGDEKAMTAAILRLLDDPKEAQRMGDEARKIREIANVDTVCRQWKEYLEDVIRNGKRA